MHAKLSLVLFGMFFSIALVATGGYLGFSAAYSGDTTSHAKSRIESTLGYYGALRYLEQGETEQAKQWLEQAINAQLLLLSFMDKGHVQKRDKARREQLFTTLFEYYDRTGWQPSSESQNRHSAETYTLVEQMLKAHHSSSQLQPKATTTIAPLPATTTQTQ